MVQHALRFFAHSLAFFAKNQMLTRLSPMACTLFAKNNRGVGVTGASY